MRSLVSLLVLVSLLAGCSGWGEDASGADLGNGPGGDPDMPSDGSMPGAAVVPAGFDDVWAAPECRYIRLTMYQDRETASQGLPPDHELQGEGVATLALLAADCPAAVVGNTTVIEPFRYAVLYHVLRAFSDDATQVDTFAREIVASTPLAATWLAPTGLPVQVGEIALSAPGQPYEVGVSARGTRFVATGVPPVEDAKPDAASYSYRFRAGDDTRSTWLQDDLRQVSRSTKPAAVVLQAEAGYLSEVFPMGTTPARLEESYGGSVLTAHIDLHA
jgi:hypothetical protein